MTKLMGILNLTPDSFSGDGTAGKPEAALQRIDAMIADGAAVIDIGAESTRPNATPLTADEEWARLEPLVRALGERVHAAGFSIDTRHAAVARKAAAAGFRWINDVSGGKDEAMLAVARSAGCTFVLMHSLSVPVNPAETLPEDCDPVKEVHGWAEEALLRCDRAGINRANIVFDPGIGFGKTAAQSLALIRRIAEFKSLGVALLAGHSRKSFLSLFTDRPAEQRDPETLVVSQFLAGQGVEYLRVHDVRSHAAMLRIKAAL